MKYFNWYSTYHDYKPSNIDNKCLALDPNLNYHWLDENCNAQAFFICVRGMQVIYASDSIDYSHIQSSNNNQCCAIVSSILFSCPV